MSLSDCTTIVRQMKDRLPKDFRPLLDEGRHHVGMRLETSKTGEQRLFGRTGLNRPGFSTSGLQEQTLKASIKFISKDKLKDQI